MGVFTLENGAWPGSSSNYHTFPTGIGIDLVYVDDHTVRLEQHKGGDIPGNFTLFEVGNPTNLRGGQLVSPLTCDFDVEGPGGMCPVSFPKSANQGYDVRLMFINNELSTIMTEHGVVPTCPASWLSAPLKYIPLNDGGAQNEVPQFVNHDDETWYRSDLANLQVMDDDASVARTAIPLETITTTSREQIPPDADFAHLLVVAENDNNAGADFELYWNAADVVSIRSEPNIRSGVAGDQIRVEINITVPINGIDTSLYFEWVNGPPGDPLVNVYALGFTI